MKNTAAEIVKKLKNAGFEAYYAGGCVRDLILNKEPEDFDIATSAFPEQIEDLFEKTYPIGKSFGVILIEENGHHFEIATFRSDSGYSDGRRPDAVMFTHAEEDAQRRDFTINGIFYDPVEEKFIDFVDGKSDLKRGLLRFIGNPDERINEDFLRILRAVRFKNRFDLDYEHNTLRALKLHASLVTQVSAERIREELTKILMHPSRAEALDDLMEFGILERILPEVERMRHTPQPADLHSEGDTFIHTKLCLQNIPPEEKSVELLWATFLHDVGKPDTIQYQGERIRFFNHQTVGAEIAKKILKRLKFSNNSKQKILWMIENHHVFDQFKDMRLVKKFRFFDNPEFENLCELHRADIYGTIPKNMKGRKLALEEIDLILDNFRYAKSEKLLPSQRKEFLGGKEIIDLLGIEPGAQVGVIKEALHEAQVENEVKTREEAVEFVRAFALEQK